MNSHPLLSKAVAEIFSIRGSQFSSQIEELLNSQNQKEALFRFLLYTNLLAFVAVFLALNGLSFSKTATLILVGYALLTVNLAFVKQNLHRKQTRLKKHIKIWLIYFRSFIYDGVLASALLFNLFSQPAAPPLIAILAVLVSSLASLIFAPRSIKVFLTSKGFLFAVAAIYAVIANDGSYNNISIVFPIIIAYTLLATMAYWLHLRQIRQLHTQLQQQYLHKQLEREQKLRERLFLYVGHDLRQPINALGMLLHTAPEQNEMIEDAQQCVRSTKRLIDDIVQIATYQGEHVVLNNSRFSLSKLLNDIEREYGADALAANCQLRIVQSSIVINNDFQLVSRAVKNFVANAITHAPGSKILIGVRRRSGVIEIQVLDQGPGIAKEEQELIFKEFSQGENGNKENGFGLGLTIAKHFAEVCGGRVVFQSKLDHGTLIGLCLPLTQT